MAKPMCEETKLFLDQDFIIFFVFLKQTKKRRLLAKASGDVAGLLTK